MSRILDDIILGVLLVALGFGSCECSSPLRAQSRPSARALADVARCLVAEDERGSDWGAILDVLERSGWRINGIYSAYGGTPFTAPRMRSWC